MTKPFSQNMALLWDVFLKTIEIIRELFIFFGMDLALTTVYLIHGNKKDALR